MRTCDLRRWLLASILAVAALTCAIVAGPASAAITQPAQPQIGPGGSAYAHKGVRVVSGGSGADAWYAFTPTGPTPKRAPLAVVTHGYFEFAGHATLDAFIEHTVRTGSVVVYPRWQTGTAAPCPGPLDIEPCMRSEVAGITGALANLKAHPEGVQADTSRASYFGFSFGGIITANLLNRWKTLGVPEPRAMFLEDPHDGGLTGADEPALDDSLAGIPASTLVECVVPADGVITDFFTPSDGRPPQSERDGSCNAVWPKLTSVPAKHKSLVLISNDDHGQPALRAIHGVCAGPGAPDAASGATPYPVDAYDWGFCWKTWDALRSCASTGTLCRYALGDTPEHRYIGTWSDGTPITGLKVQAAAPIRPEPVPARQAKPTDPRPQATITRVTPSAVRGTAADDDGVSRVQVSVRRAGRRPRFETAHGTTRWSLELPKRPGAGAYRIVVRVTDFAGQTTTVRKTARVGR